MLAHLEAEWQLARELSTPCACELHSRRFRSIDLSFAAQVLLHDAKLDRTASLDPPANMSLTQYHEMLALKAEELTWAQVSQVDVGSWKGAAWKGERVPTFVQALEVLQVSKPFPSFIKEHCRRDERSGCAVGPEMHALRSRFRVASLGASDRWPLGIFAGVPNTKKPSIFAGVPKRALLC